LEICNQADIQFRSSRNQRLTIELALVKLANLSEVSKKKTITNPEQPETVPPLSSKAESQTSEPVHTSPDPVPQTDNGISGLVRAPGISIKNSLKGTSSVKIPEDEPVPVTEQVEQRDEEKPDPTDPDALIRAWNDYAVSMEKRKPRIYSTLVNNRPVVRGDGAVMVLLNSEAQRDNFIKNIKSDLVEYIRGATGLSSVEILTEVSENEQTEKKIYTEQDKLEFLVNKNPDLGKLKSRFNLDFDD
jgi:DNA polymerase-3 subunit gamma/tau